MINHKNARSALSAGGVAIKIKLYRGAVNAMSVPRFAVVRGPGQCEYAVLQLGGAGGSMDGLAEFPGAVHLARCAFAAAHLHAYVPSMLICNCSRARPGTSICRVVALSSWVIFTPGAGLQRPAGCCASKVLPCGVRAVGAQAARRVTG